MSRNIAIGDVVRFIRSSEEGVVRSIQNGQIEVEIEDGFLIPAIEKELVVIDQGQTPTEKPNTIRIDKVASGKIYFALTKEANGWQLSLINHTQEDILIGLDSKTKESWSTRWAGRISKLDYESLHVPIHENQQWIAQWLVINDRATEAPSFVIKDFKIKPKWLISELQSIPLVKKQGIYFAINEQLGPIDSSKLRESLLGNQAPGESQMSIAQRPVSHTIDLHIENLVDHPEMINKAEILDHQLKHFDDFMDHALVSNLSEITVIHGVGNGTLKYQIQKRISGHPHVSYFKDAQKEKFGFGALYVKLK